MKRSPLEVAFQSGDATCRAWLYLPATAAPHPVIVMAHGLGGVRGMRLDAYAERFSAAGYACLVFDYRHFGDSGGQPRQLLGIKKQLADWSAAVGFARSRAELDSTRIVLWGTSFGGGHVIVTAARDSTIAAVIAQCPFTDGIASTLAMGPVSAVKVATLAIADLGAARLGRNPVMVALVGPPHCAALMTAPDALGGYLHLVPDNSTHRNEVAARVGLHIPRYRPGRHLAQLTCPILLCVCETDSVAPAAATLRYARTARRGEVRCYPEGHFDIYVGGAFDRVVADQIAFLHHHVPTDRPNSIPGRTP